MTSIKRDHPPPSPSSLPSDPKKARATPPEPFVHSVPSAAGPSTSTSTADGPPRSAPASEDSGDGFTKVLSREERRKMRKVDRHKPTFQFDLAQFRSGKKIGIAHIRDFLLYILADSQKPQWIVTENKGNISHAVLLMIPGLLPEHLGLEIPLSANLPFPTNPVSPNDGDGFAHMTPMPSSVPLLNEIFLRGVPTRAPGDNRKMHSVIQGLLNAPIPDSRRKEMEKEKNKEREERMANKSDSTDNPPPFELLLTPNQMLDNGYHLPSYIEPGDRIIIPGRSTPLNGAGHGAVAGPSKLPSGDKVDVRPLKEGWVETPEADGPPVDGRWPVLSMDCEMVLTADGQQLARVSIIDYHTGLVVLDELVQPASAVTDYRTQWSGMTAERLSHATHSLASIQEAVLTGPAAVVTPHTILLGHSLECDLNALQIRHPLCLDTALMYKHPRGAPYKPALKWLSQKYMQKEIQGGKAGHDSEEDARACVGLLKLKEEHGPDFGTFDDQSESIFDRLSRFSGTGGKVPAGTGRTSAVCDYSNIKTGHGSRATKPIKCDNDDEVVEAMIAQVPEHDLVFGRFMELANHLGFNTSETTPSELSLSEALNNLNARLSRLHSSLPKNTAFIVMNGHSDPRPMLELSARRARFERAMKEKANTGDWNEESVEDRWYAEDERLLERRVWEAREGMAFFCVK